MCQLIYVAKSRTLWCEHAVRTLRGLLWRSSTLRWSQYPNVVRELNPTLLFARDTYSPLKPYAVPYRWAPCEEGGFWT